MRRTRTAISAGQQPARGEGQATGGRSGLAQISRIVPRERLEEEE
ncbi:hypothetical protein CPAR01_00674 [Colletotrichum paranaense]|uniref:Uncharacterized protein n=7 Tax=Colletotrichum acutatum species complex TaxID=2707335 RepID=A0A9P9XFH9_9PEZI|nr:uncharacterized protein CLUP02_14357 [Colletotrichum lupini]XP_060355821.1 uncharacterized protein CPAR01_00674 [Colletotrichum paranaense]XP_060382810.1 uncharacterized protein CTAM01_06524 [Colletotrichum tamarilloi]XP_060391891.1 uncharacterized protein CABS01_15288 [Colletotrichum abscissum]KAI3546270.1 hypothetical protein CSPX01_04349 [Colletotrichum filicis]KAK0371444.1 hypothetical protein CLIM01_11208 [Colletotrichum limetticola]KAK1455821.1 hypothetical protein CMEL01_04581 [Coll